MYQSITLPDLPTTPDLHVRIMSEYNDQSQDYLDADSDIRYMSDTRTRHHALVNATRKFHMTADVIDFYSRRYLGVPATAPTYTPRDAECDILASGLKYHTVSTIIRALNGNVTPQTVRDGIAAYKAKMATRRTYNAALLARIQSQAVQA